MNKTIKKILIAAVMVASFALAFKPADALAKTKTHTVTFFYGTKSFAEPVAHGGIAIPPVDTYVPGYNFTGWVGNLFNVTEDRIVLGAYAKVQAPVYVSTTNNDKKDDEKKHHAHWAYCWIHNCWYWCTRDDCQCPYCCRAEKEWQQEVKIMHHISDHEKARAAWEAEQAAAEYEAERKEYEFKKEMWEKMKYR